MFRHCIHCTGGLGSNEALASFPVGRRLAYDPARARLWVICPHCQRWNLTPLDARFEAIDAAERRFHDTRLRFSTDHIGLARLPEGLDLVRVGAAPRPEMAAWRFGEVFRRRRRRQVALVGGAVMLVALNVSGSLAVITGGSTGLLMQLPSLMANLDRLRRVGTDPTTGSPIRRHQLEHAALASAPGGAPGEWTLTLGDGRSLARDAEGGRLVRAALALVNRDGAGERTLRDATQRLESAGSSSGLVEQLLAARQGGPPWTRQLPLQSVGTADRLALEMLLHEHDEARALAGELVELELQWQAAEEVAALADDLLVPEWVHERIARLRG